MGQSINSESTTDEQILFYFLHKKNIELCAKQFNIQQDSFLRKLQRFKKSNSELFIELEENYSKGLEEESKALLLSNVRYKKEHQKSLDINRFERKAFRESARIENAVEEYAKQILQNLKEHSEYIKNITIKHETKKSKNVGIVQLSDLHFNELINLPHNKYSFTVAAKRLQKFANEIKPLFKASDVKNVLVAFTGDILNHDKLLDKMLNRSMNRSKATILSFKLLQMFLLDLNQDFNLKVIGVLGNEGRVKDEMSFSDNVISDNYDFVIMAMLKEVFTGSLGVHFGDINKMEEVVNVLGCNILFTHGYNIKNDIEKSVTQTIGRYTARGLFIDYMLMGHIHSSRIGDLYSRSSSLCGSNAYSENGLNLYGKASQNCFIVKDTKCINSFRIDLQQYDDYTGYDVNKYLEEYNAISHEKIINNETIMKIVI